MDSDSYRYSTSTKVPTTASSVGGKSQIELLRYSSSAEPLRLENFDNFDNFLDNFGKFDDAKPSPPRDDGSFDDVPVEQRDAAEAGRNYPSGLKLTIIMLALELAVLCVALDNTIVATAIPKITQLFHALDDVGWYGSAYLLTLCAFQLFFGRLYQRFSVKWVFLFCLFVFELGSLICGVAPTSEALIVGRAVAGVGAAGIFSGALIIIAFSTPLEKRAMFTALVSAVFGIASVVGPLLGGVFTDKVSWRWCFYINLPLGGVTAVALVFFLDSPPSTQARPKVPETLRQKIMHYDPIGNIIFLPCIVCILLALQWGGTTYPWSDGRIIALLVMFSLLLIAFIGIQFWMGEDATVPVRIARQRSVGSAAIFTFCVGAAFFTLVYYLPIWFQAIRGASATDSGIDTLPMMISTTVGNIIGGAFVSITGYYTPMIYALPPVASIGAGLMTTWTVDVSTGKWIGYQILVGLGIGLGMQQGMVAAQASLPLADTAIGTALQVFAQMFGGSLFVSVAQNIFITGLLKGLAKVEDLGMEPQAVVDAGATSINTLFKDNPSLLAEVKVHYNDAILWTFRIALIMTCLSALGAAFVEWRSVKGKKIEMVHA